MAARVLIVGGAGFIGSHLARLHLRIGDEVHLLLKTGTQPVRIADIQDQVTVHRASLDSAAELADVFASARADFVYHLAVNTRRRETSSLDDALACVQEDLLHFLKLLKAAAEAPAPPAAFVHAGTLAAYGPVETPYREEQREQPLTPYAAAKVSGAHFAKAIEHRLPFKVGIARLALVFGPGQSESFLIPHLINNCLAERPTRVARPDDRRDLLHVDDAVEGLRRFAERAPSRTTILNIASGIAPTMREVAEHVVRITGADPSLIEYGGGDSGTGICDLRASTERAARLIDWSSREHWTQGVVRMVAALQHDAADRKAA